MEKERISGRHEVIMHDCMRLSMTGVTDADCFDEKRIRLFTECGEVALYGEGLHVNEMNVETGNVSVEGEIHAIVYGDRRIRKRPGFLGRLLR